MLNYGNGVAKNVTNTYYLYLKKISSGTFHHIYFFNSSLKIGKKG